MARPTKMTPEIISKLEEAFLDGASDREASLLANIAPSTLYAYCQDNPEFSERKEQLKEMVKYRARKNIVDAINEGNVSISQWYAERKMKEEFSQKTEIDHTTQGEKINDTSKVALIADEVAKKLKDENTNA